MNRAPLKRQTPIRRKAMRPGKRKTKYRRRERDFEYMVWIKTQRCCAPVVDCDGPIEAHHAGRRGLGHKAPDDTCIPLCRRHHRDITDMTFVFRWTRDELRTWQDAQIDRHRALYAMEGR